MVCHFRHLSHRLERLFLIRSFWGQHFRRVHTCWTSLSNAQRARRRWTGFGEGGTAEDLEVRARMLRCGWGLVRNMNWFLDTVLGNVMMDVVDVEFRKLKEMLDRQSTAGATVKGPVSNPSSQPGSSHLDFTTLRTIHTHYLGRLLDGCLLTNPTLTSILRSILDNCERFVAIRVVEWSCGHNVRRTRGDIWSTGWKTSRKPFASAVACRHMTVFPHYISEIVSSHPLTAFNPSCHTCISYCWSNRNGYLQWRPFFLRTRGICNGNSVSRLNYSPFASWIMIMIIKYNIVAI